MRKKRSERIDLLKAFAIIAVVLYHLSLLSYGYLGVDIFFVVAGYFFVRKVIRQTENSEIRPLGSILDKLVRLWPPVVVASAVALILGLVFMLPDDLENLSESVIASLAFSNNILSCITTKNYWDVANVYKPLMHTWYIGVLMEAYIVLIILYYITSKLSHNKKKGLACVTASVTVLSALLYILPLFSSAGKFYYLPFRIWEITLGGLIAFLPIEKLSKLQNSIGIRLLEIGSAVLLFFLFLPDILALHSSVRLILVVLFTCALIISFLLSKEKYTKIGHVFSYVGQASYSIYIWHQLIIAFALYCVVPSLDAWSVLAILLITAVVSVLSFLFAEKKLEKVKKKKILLIICIVFSVLLAGVSGVLYLRAGVIRDVPELGIDSSSVHRGMHSEYCDRPYKWDKDFAEDDRTNVLVIGNSFGRDFANILAESSLKDIIEISYVYVSTDTTYHSLLDYEDRFRAADYVFFVLYQTYDDIPEYLQRLTEPEKLYVVGDKSFGKSNGIFYAARWSDYYFEQTTSIDEMYFEKNRQMKEKYGDHYIDMITPVLSKDGKIRVFTDEQHFISQDCRHLSMFGAQYYAKVLDLSMLQP